MEPEQNDIGDFLSSLSTKEKETLAKKLAVSLKAGTKRVPTRIGGTNWYLFEPGKGTWIPYAKEELARDFGKDWSMNTIKYEGWINEPDFLNYKLEVPTTGGLKYLNSFQQPNWTPVKGDWGLIDQGLEHIFGDLKWLALDYFKVLIHEPKHFLPCICLVSIDQGTGKTWFTDLSRAIVGTNNSIGIRPEVFNKDFNADWADKLLVVIDETETEDYKGKKGLLARFKSIMTDRKIRKEGKNKDAIEIDNYTKLIICSNQEKSFLPISADDTRFWINKVPVLPDNLKVKNFESNSLAQVPAFMNYIINEHPMPVSDGRFYLPQSVYLKTEAFKLSAGYNVSVLADEIKELVQDWFLDPIIFDNDTQKFETFENSGINFMEVEKKGYWRFSPTEIQALLKRRGQNYSIKWINQTLQEELKLVYKFDYFPFGKSKKKRGYDFKMPTETTWFAK